MASASFIAFSAACNLDQNLSDLDHCGKGYSREGAHGEGQT